MPLLFLSLVGLWTLAAVPAGSAPRVSVRLFRGDLKDQAFTELYGELEPTGHEKDETTWRGHFSTASGDPWNITFHATSRVDGDTVHWSYRIENHRPDTTICSVTFPIVEDVRLGKDWKRTNWILWPSTYLGAKIDDLESAESFTVQARKACKGVDHLYGTYQGDLCLPFFVQLGEDQTFGIMVRDPTHEVLTLNGTWHETGMGYGVTVHPRVRAGETWSFGTIDLIRRSPADWHVIADRYRQWLVRQGFRPHTPRSGDVAALVYGRWDGLRTEEVLRWARALGIRDVCLWVQLYGRGDRYYPCYFPPLDLGVAGMKARLDVLRDAGLVPYFYTNGYLLSPLQTKKDAIEFSRKYEDRYPAWLAKSDSGYARTVAEFRAQGNEFAGDWLESPEGIRSLRVRRVDFRWGEFPLYFWHKRPFWTACVADPRWRKLFRDTARLHARMGAGGIFMDQVAAMRSELCSATGHGHDDDGFGFWNRAYLRLLSETKEAGIELDPQFFIETEGASDLYAKYVDRYLCFFGPLAPDDVRWPRLFRYTVPWARFDWGRGDLKDPEQMKEHVEQTLLLGAVFRVAGGGPTGEEDPNDPRLRGKPARLLKAGIEARRTLVPFIDAGRYMDDVGVRAPAGVSVRWFDGPHGVLIAVASHRENVEVRVDGTRSVETGKAQHFDWETGTTRPALVQRSGGTLIVRGVRAGLDLILIPTR